MKISDFVELPLKCFKVFGLIPHKTANVGSWKRKLLAVYHVLVIFNQIITGIGIAAFIKHNIGDLVLMISDKEPVSAFSYNALEIVKIITFYLRQNDFKDLIDTLTDLFPKTKAEQETLKVANYLTGYKKTERTSMMIGLSACVLYFAIPIAKLITTRTWFHPLTLAIWYPFDEYDSKFYNFVFLWEAFITVTLLAVLLGTDLILYAFITLISMQFDILCHRLRQMKDVPTSGVKNTFIELVELHTTLLRLSEKLQRIYSYSIFFYVFGSSIFLCMYLNQISLAVSSETVVRFSLFLSASLLQILVLCYYGSKLITSSANVAEAAYDSGWHCTENAESKYFSRFMILRSQKPNAISAYKFSVVSLNAFASVSFDLILLFIYQ